MEEDPTSWLTCLTVAAVVLSCTAMGAFYVSKRLGADTGLTWAEALPSSTHKWLEIQPQELKDYFKYNQPFSN